MLQPGTAQPLAGQIGREKRERRPVVALCGRASETFPPGGPYSTVPLPLTRLIGKPTFTAASAWGTKTPTPATSSNRGTGTGIPAGVRALRGAQRARGQDAKKT